VSSTNQGIAAFSQGKVVAFALRNRTPCAATGTANLWSKLPKTFCCQISWRACFPASPQGGKKEEVRLNWQKAFSLAAAGNADLRNAISRRLDGPITDATFR
jgi:hypothetical protein